MLSAVWIVREHNAMPSNLKDVEHMMPAHRDHPRRGLGGPILEPVGRKPQIADGLAEHLDGYAATTESRARATAWMVHDTYSAGFAARVARDNRAYLVATIALAFGLVVMLAVGAHLVRNGWPRHATPHIAVNNPDNSWCLGFDGLSCKHKDSARE